MSDNLPAIREDRAPMATADTDSWVQVMGPIVNLAKHIADTEFVPKGLRSAPAVAAAMLYGREVGLAPMTALNMLHVVEGKPGLSAEGMRALVLAGGHEIEVVETTGAQCIMRGRRRGSETWTAIAWTLDMARAANLLGKNNWKSHPRQMLQARCTTELCRLVFPDVIHGFRSIEELEDMSERDDGPGGLEAPRASSRVGRRGAAKRAAALPPATSEAPAPSGPPLPGEPGYDDETSEVLGGTSEPDVPGGTPEDGTEESDAEGATDAAPSAPEQTSEGEAGEPSGEAVDTTPPVSPRGASRAQTRMIFAELSAKFGVDNSDREERLYLCGRVLQRQLTTFDDLTSNDAKALIDTFARLKDRAALDALLDTIDQAEQERQDAERQDLAGEPEGDES